MGDQLEFKVERVPAERYAGLLCSAFALPGLTPDQLCGLSDADLLTIPAGVVFHDPKDNFRAFWVLIEGEVYADKVDPDGTRTRFYVAKPGESFGEVYLLAGKAPMLYLQASKDSVGLRLGEDIFWNLMSCSPAVRSMVLKNMSLRLQSHMVEAAHREKLVSLGTLAAGLMHELHNPGSAAKRASSQLRAKLLRLQELSLRFCDRETTPTQLACMRELQEEAIAHSKTTALSTLEQADAEESLAEWLDTNGVEDAYKIAPSLVNIGIDSGELECMRDEFGRDGFSDALNWLESLVSSVSLVDAIEESISRISDLVMAVKKFAYDDRCTLRDVDVHDSIQSTLTILGHKLRLKRIEVVKHFEANPASIHTTGVAISQVWTNLLDNAIDASPEGSKIEVRTWSEPGFLSVGILDHGSGIPPEVLEHIFEPFYTTKPVGKGTGLGLEIVQRIVTQNFGGKIQVDSKPGATQFTIRLPRENAGVQACEVPASVGRAS
jgi:signal transduction histidine kinase